MRGTRIISRVVVVMAVLAVFAALGGCKKHENFPTQIDLIEAPAPDSFVVVSNGINSDGAFDYDLTWQISDNTNVDHYRLYVVGQGFAPELVYETNANETSDMVLPITLPSNGQGLQFGLSTVSTGSVESAMTLATIPPPGP